jgi:hypothetical protein
MGIFFTKTIGINIWVLLLIYIIYALLSSFLFAFTTSGYNLLGSVLISILGYGFLFLLLFIGCVFRVSRSRRRTEILHTLFLFVSLPAQILLLVLNTGDCGDSPCSPGFEPNMLRNILGLSQIHSFQVAQIILPIFIIYSVSLFIVVLGSLVGKSEEK